MTFLSTEPKFSDSDNVLLGKILQQLITSPGGGGGSQTPWTANINGGGFNLFNAGTVTATSFVGALTGNASTATVLQTARTINGVSFNGSADITIPAASQTPWTSDIDGAGFDLNNVTTVFATEVAAQNIVVLDPSDALGVMLQFSGPGFQILDSALNPKLVYNASTWDFVGGLEADSLLLNGSLQFTGTNHFGVKLNTLTTAQRDAVGVGSAGNVLWNSTTSRYDFNIGGSWKNFVRLDGDTMTGRLTVAQATANTAAFASTGYSLTGANAQSLIDLAGTWNTSGTPTAFKLNITNAASNAASLLADFQIGGSSVVSIKRTGEVTSVSDFYVNSNSLAAGIYFGTGGGDVFIGRDAANALALRNSTNAQRLRVYNTYTDASNGEWITFDWQTTANVARLGTMKNGTGATRALQFSVGNTDVANFSTSGHLLFNTDNTYDIGASGATRPRTGYFGTDVRVGGQLRAPLFVLDSGAGAIAAIRTTVTDTITLLDSALTGFNRLQFGGTTDSFGAVGRDGAGIKIVGAAGSSTAWIKVPGVTVANLPAAATAGGGARAYVTDAVSQVFGATVTGSGSVPSPVYSDGTVWRTG